MPSGSYVKTQEHRKNLSLSRKGMVFSESHRRALSISHKGKTFKHFEETKEKQRISNVGQKRSDETKAKLKIARARQIPHSPSIEARLRVSEQRRGSKCYAWKGGITLINRAIRNRVEYRLWRESVFKRDDFTCPECKTRGRILNAHHIKAFAYFPELRFAIDNGVTLCLECHKKTDTYGPKKRSK